MLNNTKSIQKKELKITRKFFNLIFLKLNTIQRQEKDLKYKITFFVRSVHNPNACK